VGTTSVDCMCIYGTQFTHRVWPVTASIDRRGSRVVKNGAWRCRVSQWLVGPLRRVPHLSNEGFKTSDSLADLLASRMTWSVVDGIFPLLLRGAVGALCSFPALNAAAARRLSVAAKPASIFSALSSNLGKASRLTFARDKRCSSAQACRVSASGAFVVAPWYHYKVRDESSNNAENRRAGKEAWSARGNPWLGTKIVGHKLT